jgi:transposase
LQNSKGNEFRSPFWRFFLEMRTSFPHLCFTMNSEHQEQGIAGQASNISQHVSNFFRRITTLQKVLPFFFSDDTPELPITKSLEKLIHTIETLELHRSLPEGNQWLGRKRSDRLTLAHCFIAKCVLNIPTTKALIERLAVDASLRRIVGFETKKSVPNESTFSRAFKEFSDLELFAHLHATIIKEHLGDELLDNINRDATAIEAREKPNKKRMQQLKEAKLQKAAKKKAGGKKRGRPSKEAQLENTSLAPTPAAAKESNVIEKQSTQSLKENLQELSTVCDVGTKCNAQGFKNTWIGYKLHIDTNSFGVPISAILTSASVHDSQVAIPLTQMSKERVTNLYDIMDAGYCSESLREYSRQEGHVPLIDHNARRGEKREFLDFEAERYKSRSGSERCNGRLKDEYGANNIRVKGHTKIYSHLMIGIVCLAVDALLRAAT